MDRPTAGPAAPDGSYCQRVLIIEDDPLNRRVLASILAPDLMVTLAGDGAQALTRLATPPLPDLVLLDLVLPDVDGYGLLRQLTAAPETAAIPVVVVSALNTSGDEIRGLELGAVDYITKPFHPALVRARVHNHLALARARRQLERQNRELQDAARLRDDVDHILRHDLKSPIASVLSAAELLSLDADAGDRARTTAREIARSSARVLEMVDRYLILAQLESGRFRPPRDEIDLVVLIAAVVAELGRGALRRAIAIRLLVDGALPDPMAAVPILGEVALMSTLFGNLVKNAVEASPDHAEVVIEIATAPAPVITIRNAGEVPAAIRERMFEKYTTGGKRGGVGLGCYSARLIATAFGGSVGLAPSPPGHTAVTVTLPAAPVSEAAR